jgi:hypothetical protein
MRVVPHDRRRFLTRHTKKIFAIGVLLNALGQLLFAAQSDVPRFAVRRLFLSVDANPATGSDYGRNARDEAIELLRRTGATHFHYAEQWSKLEPRAGAFDLGKARVPLSASSPLPVAFTLKIIDAGRREMPDSYKGLAWDAPEMVERVTRLIDQLAPLLHDRPWTYAVGNEIDTYFAQRPGEIAAYARLLAVVKARVRAHHPRASFTTAFQSSALPLVHTLYAPIVGVLDHIGVTYYPLNADLSVRPPQQSVADIAAALTFARGVPIAFQEIGYPSATRLGSSPEQQAEFMRLAFESIRAAGTARILGATYLFQSDLPQWLVSDLVAAYGLSSENFRAFLTTLGLRDHDDSPKPAWTEFIRQTDIVGRHRRQ